MSKTALAWLLLYTAGLGLSLLEPFYALVAYLVDYYAHPPLRWWGRALPDLRWSLLAAGVLLFAYLLKGRSPLDSGIVRHGQTKWLLGYLAVASVVTLWAVDRSRSVVYLGDIAKLVLLYLLIVGTVRSRDQFRWFVLVMIIGAFLWGLDAYADPKRKGARLYGIGGPDSDSDNSTAAHLITVLPFIGVYFLAGRRWERILSLVAAPFVVNTIILCNSRGATVGIAAAALAAIVLAKGKARWQVAALSVLGGLLALSLMDRQFIERQLTLLEYEEDSSVSGRVVAWMGALRLMADYPLGVGGGGFDALSPVYLPELVESYGGEERTAHNTYLLVGSDWGIPGLVLFIGFLGSTLRTLHGIRQRTSDRRIYLESFAIEVALVGFLTAAFFINRPYAEVLYWLSALAAALRNIADGVWEEAAAEPAVLRAAPSEPESAA